MRWLSILGAAVVVLVVLIVVVGTGSVIFERIRRWREDRSGFSEWFSSGAPYAYPELLQAFRETDSSHRVIRAGYLHIPSGTIIAVDPAYLTEDGIPAEPFDEAVPIGDWPLDAVIMDGLVAALRVLWSDAEIAHFEPAFTKQSRQDGLKRRTLPGIYVDSATCCVTSSEGRDAYTQNRNQDIMGSDDPERVTEVKYAAGINLFCCRSGKGDGTYSCYFAKTSEGRSVGMFVDFGPIGQPERIKR